jgi:hypothetical protein
MGKGNYAKKLVKDGVNERKNENIEGSQKFTRSLTAIQFNAKFSIKLQFDMLHSPFVPEKLK